MNCTKKKKKSSHQNQLVANPASKPQCKERSNKSPWSNLLFVSSIDTPYCAPCKRTLHHIASDQTQGTVSRCAPISGMPCHTAPLPWKERASGVNVTSDHSCDGIIKSEMLSQSERSWVIWAFINLYQQTSSAETSPYRTIPLRKCHLISTLCWNKQNLVLTVIAYFLQGFLVSGFFF